MEKETRNPLVTAAKGQLFSCYQMLETLVDVCPDEIWQSVYGEVPFWYQVYHTAYFVDYWLREDRAARIGDGPPFCHGGLTCMGRVSRLKLPATGVVPVLRRR